MSDQCSGRTDNQSTCNDIYDIDPGQAEVTQSTLPLDLCRLKELRRCPPRAKQSGLALSLLTIQEAQGISCLLILYLPDISEVGLGPLYTRRESVLPVGQEGDRFANKMAKPYNTNGLH